jgi:cytochrome c553
LGRHYPQKWLSFRSAPTAQGRDTMMNGVLRGFSDRDIADMAHYFAQLR